MNNEKEQLEMLPEDYYKLVKKLIYNPVNDERNDKDGEE